MGATNYQFQKNVNNTGWVTIQSGTVADSSQAFNFNIDAVHTDTIQFRVLLEDLNVPQPYTSETENGNVFTVYPNLNGSNVSGVFVKGEWTTETGVQTIRGKCSSAYERQQSFRVVGDAPFLVRVTRVTPDSTTAYLVNKTYFSSIAYAIEEKFRYPGSVLVATRVSAEQFSSIPTRAYRCKMLKVKIPTNYDPLTRVYTGVWDGTFKVAWTNNPAWCFYDLITNTRYGLGERIPASSVDKWALYEIAQYCDELVPTSNGTMEPRFTCNVLIQTREEAYRVISDFASIFRGMTYWGNGTIVAVQDSPKIPAYAFTNANVVDGMFEYQSTNISTRYNTCAVTWNNVDDFGRRWVEYIEDTEAITKLGYVNETQVVAFGCTSRDMAQRVGRWLLYTNNYETDLITFSTGLEGVLPRPGEAIQVSDSLRSQDRRGGRIKSSTTSSLVIDKVFTFVSGKTYTVSVIGSDGVLQENTYAHNGETDTLVFATPFASEIAKDSIYIIADDTIEPQIFKVVSVSEGDNNKYTITALSHNPTKYNYIERGYPLEDLRLPTKTIYPVTSLNYSQTVYVDGVNPKTRLDLSWDEPLFASSYLLKIKAPDGVIREIKQRERYYTLTDGTIGTYTITIYAFNALGSRSSPFTQKIEYYNPNVNPNDVDNFSLRVRNGDAVLQWDASEEPYVKYGGYIIIKHTTKTTGASWEDGLMLVKLPASVTSYNVPLLHGTYMAKYQNSQGWVSVNPATALSTFVGTDYSVSTISEHPTFVGDKTNLSVTPEGVLYLNTGSLDGSYLFSNIMDIGKVHAVTLSANLSCYAISSDGGLLIDDRLELIDTWEWFDGAGVSDYTLKLYISTTLTDPLLATNEDWTAWTEFVIGEYEARAYRFKMEVVVPSLTITPYFDELSVIATAKPRVDGDNDISVSSSSGAVVTFNYPFAQVPSILANVDVLATGDYVVVSNKSAEGFTAQTYNASGVPVNRQIDWIAQGYGYVKTN